LLCLVCGQGILSTTFRAAFSGLKSATQFFQTHAYSQKILLNSVLQFKLCGKQDLSRLSASNIPFSAMLKTLASIAVSVFIATPSRTPIEILLGFGVLDNFLSTSIKCSSTIKAGSRPVLANHLLTSVDTSPKINNLNE